MKTTVRHVCMILFVPVDTRGERSTTGRIVSQLRLAGFNVSDRTVQRDLVALIGKFGIVREIDGHGMFWWYRTHPLECAQ